MPVDKPYCAGCIWLTSEKTRKIWLLCRVQEFKLNFFHWKASPQEPDDQILKNKAHSLGDSTKGLMFTKAGFISFDHNNSITSRHGSLGSLPCDS